jgi:hypothetical protein
MIFGTAHLIMSDAKPGAHIDVHKHNDKFELLCGPLGIDYEHGAKQSYTMRFNWQKPGILPDYYRKSADKLSALVSPAPLKEASPRVTEALAEKTAPITGAVVKAKAKKAKKVIYHYECKCGIATNVPEAPLDTPCMCPRCQIPMFDMTTEKAEKVALTELLTDMAEKFRKDGTLDKKLGRKPKAAADVTPEASPDVTPEASPDAAPEASPDAAPEASPPVTKRNRKAS